MFDRLKKKWKVNNTQLFLILCVFAVTGTTTAYVTRQITGWMNLAPSSAWYWILKIAVLVFGYQLLILLVSIPFGQFRFFWNYEKKILRWFVKPGKNRNTPNIQATSMHQVAVFASGKGSNAQQLISYFHNHSAVQISLIVTNNAEAGVLSIALKEGIPTLILNKEQFFRGNAYVTELQERGIDFIVLAGFLWKVPPALIAAYPAKIINIHPALLPKFGGKGMFGAHVHQAVLNANEQETGITIHYVDELYDHGNIIFQAKCSVSQTDTPESLARKVQELEHRHFPQQVEKVITTTRQIT